MNQSLSNTGKHTTAAFILALAAPLAAAASHGQEIVHATGPLPTFEVATVKPASPDSGAWRAMIAEGAATAGVRATPTTTGGERIQRTVNVSYFPGYGPVTDRVEMTFKAKFLIAKAYGLPLTLESRIVGGPAWINNDAEGYQVQGKIDDAEFSAMQKKSSADQKRQVQLMEQALLADRFHLKVHFDIRDLPVYALVIAKGGPKLIPAKPNQAPHLMGTGDGQNSVLTAQSMTIGEFVQSPLLRLEGRIVIDRTGLTGPYDFTLKSSIGADPDAAGPSLFTALEEQLGLKLVPTKAPLEVIVIDHIERPDPN